MRCEILAQVSVSQPQIPDKKTIKKTSKRGTADIFIKGGLGKHCPMSRSSSQEDK